MTLAVLLVGSVRKRELAKHLLVKMNHGIVQRGLQIIIEECNVTFSHLDKCEGVRRRTKTTVKQEQVMNRTLHDVMTSRRFPSFSSKWMRAQTAAVRSWPVCLCDVSQFTEEKLGQAEKTELDAHFENLMSRADCTKNWTEKIYRQTEILLQPNPSMTSI